MSLFACDQSTTKFGFAIGGVSDPGPRTFVVKGPGADEMVIDRMLAGYAETVSLWAKTIKAEHCVIEAPLLLNDSAHGAHTSMALIQLTGAIRAAAKRAGCQVHLVAVSTVRKHFIGQGRLPGREAKRLVMDRCRQLGWEVEDDNAADAAALWSWGMSTYYPRWSPNGTPLFARGRAA